MSRGVPAEAWGPAGLARRGSRAGAVLLALVVGTACCQGSPAGPSDPTTTPPPDTVHPAGADRSMPAGESAPPKLALGTRGAVTSAAEAASVAGLEILAAGGNAVDAAVAVGFALAVAHPSAGNIGGGGFMVLRLADGSTAAIDYRETAPGAASRDMYLDDKGDPTDARLVGPLAAGIPGTVAGLALAHARYGTMPWIDVVMPAVKLAESGHVLDSWHVEDLERGSARMRDAGFDASAQAYRRSDGSPYAEGDVWVQPELGRTLRAIAEEGPAGFYEGVVAQTMVDAVRAAGGIWTVEDLRGYVAKPREPITFEYRGHTVTTMPPPSAGGVVLRQILAAAEVMNLRAKPWRSVDEVHLYVEATRRTYADRNLLLGDPDFVELPMERLLDVAYVSERVANIDPARATPSSEISAGLPPGREESHQTTHFSVVDGDGNAVSNTTTLNLGFGCRWVAGASGVLLNNEMDDFAVKPGTANAFGLVQGEPNRIEPGKRMLSSMTPTILAKDGELRAVVGSPGGPTITTTVAQIVRALVDYELPIEDAVDAPRVHHQWLPDRIVTEDRIPDELANGLRARGHEVVERGTIGHANCIEVDPTTRGFRAVADVSRDGGAAVAY
jgi:gamma-glutamyltranspeptidase / glutathione hydrolase